MAVHMVTNEELKIFIGCNRDLQLAMLTAKYAADEVRDLLAKRFEFDDMSVMPEEYGIRVMLFKRQARGLKIIASFFMEPAPEITLDDKMWCSDCQSFLSESSERAGCCMKCAAR